MLTNSIQFAVVPPNRPATLFQSAGPGPSSFASTLQSAGTPAPSRPQAGLGTVAGQGKSVVTKTSENFKTSASATVAQPMGPPAIGDAKSPPIIALTLNLDAKPPSPADTIAPVASSPLGTAVELVAGADQPRQDWFAGKFQQDALVHNSGTEFDSTSSVTAPDAGRQTPTGDPALQTNGAAPKGKQAMPLEVNDTRTPLSPLNSSDAIQRSPVSGSAPAADVVSSASAGSLASNSRNLEVLAQLASPSTTEAAGIAGHGGPPPASATPIQSGIPLPAIGPAGVADAAAEANQSGEDSQLQSGNGPGSETPSGSTPASPVSNTPFSLEISKPISVRAAIATKATKIISALDPQVKQGPEMRVPSNQEGASLKSPGSSSNSAVANAPPQRPDGFVPVAAAGQANDGVQPSAAAATASVMVQVSPAANQDSSSRIPATPAESQSPAPNSTAPLPAGGAVEVDRLVAGLTQSEMHIGLHTQAFGSVEVHTVVRDSQVGLTMGSERGDLRTLLAPEISGLQTTFRQHDLNFDNIRFLETSPETTAGFSSGADSQPRSSDQPHSSPVEVLTIHSPPEDQADLDAGSKTRLNVHA